MRSIRERLGALRTSAPGPRPGGEAPPPAARPEVAAPSVAQRGAGGPEVAEALVRVSRRPIAEWNLGDEERAATMRMLALLGRDDRLGSAPPSRLAFLDLETTGLSLGAGTLAFLVGLAWLEEGSAGWEVVIEQRMLRALSHEAAMLRATLERLDACDALVTFNGKSYDLPLMQGRCVLARVGPVAERPHFDALHPARRLLGSALPDVRLTSLEGALWGERRPDDLPGAAIPAAFFASLRGDDGLLDDILRHNADDLATLARLPPLLARLAAGGSAPTGLAADPLALAALHLEDGRRSEAMEALARCRALPGSPRALRHARLTKRAAGAEAAREHWMRLCGAPRAGPEPFEEVAKLLEHRDRDPRAALDWVERALQRASGDAAASARLEHRRSRLLRKAARASRAFPERHDSG